MSGRLFAIAGIMVVCALVALFVWGVVRKRSAVDTTPQQAARLVLYEVEAPAGVRCFLLPSGLGGFRVDGLTCVPACGRLPEAKP